MSPTLGGGRSNKLREGWTEGEGIQATRGGVALVGRQSTPARTGESMWSRQRNGLPLTLTLLRGPAGLIPQDCGWLLLRQMELRYSSAQEA